MAGNYTELNKIKHILFLTPGFPKDEQDTQCIPALQLFIKTLQKTDQFIISIISFQYPYISREYKWHDVNVYSVGGKNKKGVFRFLNWRRITSIAHKINDQTPIDQLHSFWLTECAFIGNKLSKKWNIAHSCTLMGQDALRDNNYFNKIRPLPTLIALSNFHKKEVITNFKVTPQHIIPWGIENTPRPIESERRIDILGVGNLIPLKGFDQFIEVIFDIKLQFPNIVAEIIGDGTERELLEKKVIEKQLEKNILFTGALERNEVLKKMTQSKCLLHLSEYESFGMILIEALEAGNKVFSSNVGIAAECDNIILLESTTDAIDKISDHLKNSTKAVSVYPFTIEKTVRLYLDKIFH